MMWLLIGIGVFYLVFTLGFATWSETNNGYGKFGMDMMYGILWPITLGKWLYRLPGRLVSGPSDGIVRVVREVWNG